MPRYKTQLLGIMVSAGCFSEYSQMAEKKIWLPLFKPRTQLVEKAMSLSPKRKSDPTEYCLRKKNTLLEVRSEVESNAKRDPRLQRLQHQTKPNQPKQSVNEIVDDTFSIVKTMKTEDAINFINTTILNLRLNEYESIEFKEKIFLALKEYLSTSEAAKQTPPLENETEQAQVDLRSKPAPRGVESFFHVFDKMLKVLSNKTPNNSERLTIMILENIARQNIEAGNKLTAEEKKILRDRWGLLYPEFMYILDLDVLTKNKADEDIIIEFIPTSLSVKAKDDSQHLPNPNKWQGESVEAFSELLRLRQDKKYSNSLSFENKNWVLDYESFKPIPYMKVGQKKIRNKYMRNYRSFRPHF